MHSEVKDGRRVITLHKPDIKKLAAALEVLRDIDVLRGEESAAFCAMKSLYVSVNLDTGELAEESTQ